MLLLHILIVIVFWSDLCEAVDYLRRLPERRQIRRTAREACDDLDLEYERLLRSYRCPRRPSVGVPRVEAHPGQGIMVR